MDVDGSGSVDGLELLAKIFPEAFCPDSKAGVQTCVGVFRLLEMATLQQSFLVFAGFLGVEKEEALHLAQGFRSSEFGVGSGV